MHYINKVLCRTGWEVNIFKNCVVVENKCDSKTTCTAQVFQQMELQNNTCLMTSGCMLMVAAAEDCSEEWWTFLYTLPSEISLTGKTTAGIFTVVFTVWTTRVLNLTPLTHVALFSVTDFISNWLSPHPRARLAAKVCAYVCFLSSLHFHSNGLHPRGTTSLTFKQKEIRSSQVS